LKLGFHSGTVPKLYRKLRRAERRGKIARKQREALHHLGAAVRHFTEREFVYLLDMSRSWGKVPFSVGRVEMGCTSIRIELLGPEASTLSAWVVFELRDGSLAACVQRWGWLKSVREDSQPALAVALAGWFALAAVESDCPTAIASISIPW